MGRFYHGGDFLRWMGANRPYGGDFTIWYSLLGGDVAILDGDSARGEDLPCDTGSALKPCASVSLHFDTQVQAD